MTDHFFHPALARLLRYQAIARVRRIGRGFTTPRRLLLSLVGLALAAIWLGNAALSIVLREPTDPSTLRQMVPLGLLTYALWHLVKVAYRRPEDAHEWTTSEREFLGGGPFLRRHLLTYRLASIVTAAALKAGCFALLMLPDLPSPLVGPAGALLALIFLDLWRMAVEITAWGLSDRAYRRTRAVVLMIAGAVVVSAGTSALCAPDLGKPTPLGLLLHVLGHAGQLAETWVGTVCLTPFMVFGRVILAAEFSIQLAGSLVVAAAMVLALGWLVMYVDEYFQRDVVRREQQAYPPLDVDGERDARTSQRKLATIPWCRGAGPIAWRQLLGAYHYRTSLLVALAAPTALTCLPLIVFDQPVIALLNVVGGLAFYTLVLLPAALKFDFRRDVDRMAVLKSLPIRPVAVVAGQLATPVLIATVFQLAVLLVALLVRPVPLWMVTASVLLLLPLNVLIFALDNLIFLWYPYRLNQEGIEIFLRTTLTFTAKGLIFAGALAGMLVVAVVTRVVAQALVAWGGPLSDGRVLFLSATLGMIWAAVFCTAYLLVRAYCRFDASQDMPA